MGVGNTFLGKFSVFVLNYSVTASTVNILFRVILYLHFFVQTMVFILNPTLHGPISKPQKSLHLFKLIHRSYERAAFPLFFCINVETFVETFEQGH